MPPASETTFSYPSSCERPSCERRAVAGGAVRDDRLGAVGDRLLDPRFEPAARKVDGAGDVAFVPLLAFTDVDENGWIRVVVELARPFGVDLVDLLPGLLEKIAVLSSLLPLIATHLGLWSRREPADAHVFACRTCRGGRSRPRCRHGGFHADQHAEREGSDTDDSDPVRPRAGASSSTSVFEPTPRRSRSDVPTSSTRPASGPRPDASLLATGRCPRRSAPRWPGGRPGR